MKRKRNLKRDRHHAQGRRFEPRSESLEQRRRLAFGPIELVSIDNLNDVAGDLRTEDPGTRGTGEF